jgi:hypothetical protein
MEKEIKMPLDALKLIAESYGFELVEKQQTAVEWLVEQISYTTTNKEIISYHKDISELVNQAKEMEKQQLQEEFEKGQLSTHKLA